MCSVRLDVATHAKLSAAASLSGVDKSTFCARAITEAVAGVVVIDRRKTAGHGNPSGEEVSASGDGDVE
jgi:hypothetical protein